MQSQPAPQPEPEISNIIELHAIVIADGCWFLSDIDGPVWTQNVTKDTAHRFSLTAAMKFAKSYRKRANAMQVRVEPTV